MKKLFIFFVASLVFISCIRRDLAPEVKKACSDYIYFIKKKAYKKNGINEIMILINKVEARNKKVTAYRIAAQPRLLPLNIVPNKIFKINKYDVLFLGGTKNSNTEKLELEKRLYKMKIYSDEAYQINSNYPEWVLLIDGSTHNFHLVTDAWYRPLDTIIAKLDHN
jgi:hypothetical protein